MACLKAGVFGWDVLRLIPPGQRWKIQEKSITVGCLILHTSTSILVSHRNRYSTYLSSVVLGLSISLCDMSSAFLTLSNTISPHNETNHWCFSGTKKKKKKNTRLTPPSLHCDQIAKHCLTEWGWRVAYSTTERCQKAVQREIFIWESTKPGFYFPWLLFTAWLKHHIKERLASTALVDHRTVQYPELGYKTCWESFFFAQTLGFTGRVILLGFVWRRSQVQWKVAESNV